MNDNQISGRLGWLGAVLAAQRCTLSNVLLRLKGIGVRAGTSFDLHRKFMRLLEQVACEREKELGILNEIEEVEKRHSEMKQRKLLRRAGSEKIIPAVQTVPADKPKQSGLWMLMLLFYLFSRRSINHKNQDLTVD